MELTTLLDRSLNSLRPFPSCIYELVRPFPSCIYDFSNENYFPANKWDLSGKRKAHCTEHGPWKVINRKGRKLERFLSGLFHLTRKPYTLGKAFKHP
jgi:hypothetical protein